MLKNPPIFFKKSKSLLVLMQSCLFSCSKHICTSQRFLFPIEKKTPHFPFFSMANIPVRSSPERLMIYLQNIYMIEKIAFI